MQVTHSKMYIVQLFASHGGRVNKSSSLGNGEWKYLSVFIAACLLYLSAMASANSNDWKSSVPKSSYAPSSAASNGGTTQIRHAQYNQQMYNSHHHNNDPHRQRSVTPLEYASASSSVAANNAPSWYTSQSNAPRMGFFSADSASSSSSTPQDALVPQPRSLSNLPSPTISYNPTTTTNTTTATNFSSNSDTSKSKIKKKKRDQLKKKTARAIDGASSSTSNAIVAAPKNELKRFETGSSRTFLLTPLLAYLVPVFIAQMFGMGMIPAAALITLPIFLLPIGLTAAVFLV